MAEPRRSRRFSTESEYFGYKCRTQGLKEDLLEVGVSHSSDETSNDRGEKGRQIERKRGTMTVLSNDGISWLTRLERIGEKSACNKQQKFNNLGYLLSSDMLKGQFQRLDGNKAVVTKAAYGEHLDENINNLIKRIRRGHITLKPPESRRYPKRTV